MVGRCWLTRRIGTYQGGVDRRERVGPDQGREAGHGDVAGHMVSGVSGGEA